MKSAKDIQAIATSTSEIAAKLRSTNGRLFTVTFVKANGEERKLTGRLGVTKHLAGGINTVKHLTQYLTVAEFGNKSVGGKVVYRNVNLDSVLSAKVGGKVYVVNQSGEQS